MSMRATSGEVFAWASIAAEACLNTLNFAIRVLSAPMSTSLIRPNAASMLLRCLERLTSWNSSLDIVAPFWARNAATFSIAVRNTPTEILSRLMVLVQVLRLQCEGQGILLGNISCEIIVRHYHVTLLAMFPIDTLLSRNI